MGRLGGQAGGWAAATFTGNAAELTFRLHVRRCRRCTPIITRLAVPRKYSAHDTAAHAREPPGLAATEAPPPSRRPPHLLVAPRHPRYELLEEVARLVLAEPVGPHDAVKQLAAAGVLHRTAQLHDVGTERRRRVQRSAQKMHGVSCRSASDQRLQGEICTSCTAPQAGTMRAQCSTR